MSNPFQVLDDRLSRIEHLLHKIREKQILTKHKLAFSKKEFADKINKSTSFVDQERRAGRLAWKLNGGTVSIPATELEKYI